MFQRGLYTPMYGMGMGGPMNMGGPMGMSNMGRGGLGLFSSLKGGSSLIKGVNWGGLLNNASRALGVVNQAVPLVKQAGPMFNNMKSMLKIASAFKDETDKDTKTNTTQKTQSDHIQEEKSSPINYQYDNQPNFFIN